MTKPDADVEDVGAFRLRAREWIHQNLPELPTQTNGDDDESPALDGDDAWLRARELQRLLFSGGFAGLCYPKQYGGQGLSRDHQRVFNEEVAGFETPRPLQTPTFTICGPTILDMGTEEQKFARLPAAIRGDEVFVQFLSEPSSGSDLAGATTRATRDGDSFILKGSKIWSSGAYAADWALCLARTNWDVPKHSGLTIFLLPVHQPGIEIRRIKQVDGGDEFCEEFIDDVRVPIENVVGEIDEGWKVVTRLLFHERNAVGNGSQYRTGGRGNPLRPDPGQAIIDLARKTGQATDIRVRELIAESHALTKVQAHLIDRVVEGMRTESLPPPAGSIIRLFSGESATRRAEIALEIAGAAGVVSPAGKVGDRQHGETFLSRQAESLGGGSTEMARNIISERVLGMPREYAADRNVPFNQVSRGR